MTETVKYPGMTLLLTNTTVFYDSSIFNSL